jgi:uncharacterized protein YutE (UPF0331/DUF86 family)
VSPSSIRAAVVADKAQIIARMLAGIETLPLDTLQGFVADPRMVAAGESFLRRALEALFDIGRHVLAKGFGDPATEYKEIADRLGQHGVLREDQVKRLRKMAGYRNRLVHFYDEVSAPELHEILTTRLEDVREALDALRAWMAENPDRVDQSL